MSKINKIKLSGTTYDIQDLSATSVVNVTQAEYDALVTSGTVDPTTLYNITDAQAGDLSQYWTSAQTNSAITQATSGKVNSSSVVTAVTSGSTDSQIPTAKAVYDAIPTGGTGGSYSAGTNISIANDTISCTLPISGGSGYNSIILNNTSNSASGYYNLAGGLNCSVDSSQSRAFVYGSGNSLYGYGNGSAVFGEMNSGSTYATFIGGRYNATKNSIETAFGVNCNSVSGSSIFGHSGNTLFSVGNGETNSRFSKKHNAIEIKQNGDIYIANTDDTTSNYYYEKPMYRLQDTIAALGGLKLQQITQADYDALVQAGTVDASTLYIITNVVS